MCDEPDYTGELVFLGGGKIMGYLNPYDVEFTATLDTRTQEPTRTVKDVWKEWKEYNEKAHAKEVLGRWGRYYNDDDEDDEDDEGDCGSDEHFVNPSYIDYPHLSVGWSASRYDSLS